MIGLFRGIIQLGLNIVNRAIGWVDGTAEYDSYPFLCKAVEERRKWQR